MVWLTGGMLRGQELGLGFQADPDPARVLRAVGYTLNVTNLSGEALNGLVIEVDIRGGVTLTDSSNSLGSATNLASVALFTIPALTNRADAVLTYSGIAVDPGVITHRVIGAIGGVAADIGLFTTTNINGVARLTAAWGSLPGGVVQNDLVAGGLTISNEGPDDAAGVVVRQELPAGLHWVSVAPPSLPVEVRDANAWVTVGSLAAGSEARLQLAFQPEPAGTMPLIAAVEAPGFENPVPPGATSRVDLLVSTSSFADLEIALRSPQVLNRQTGLLEQRIGLSNAGAGPVAAARVLVSGWTNGLFNAWGTNGVTPFVTYPAPLVPGQSVELVLQSFSPSRQAGPDPELAAVGVPVPRIPIPEVTVVNGTRLLNWTAGQALIEFPAVEGARYAIRYASTPAMTNSWIVQPLVTAPGSWVQWFDDGPPATLTLPSAAAGRYYQVVEVVWP